MSDEAVLRIVVQSSSDSPSSEWDPSQLAELSSLLSELESIDPATVSEALKGGIYNLLGEIVESLPKIQYQDITGKPVEIPPNAEARQRQAHYADLLGVTAPPTPQEEAKKRVDQLLHMEEVRKLVDEMLPIVPVAPPILLTPEEEAKKRVDRLLHLNEVNKLVDEMMKRLEVPVLELTPSEKAKDLYDKWKERQEVLEELAKLKPADVIKLPTLDVIPVETELGKLLGALGPLRGSLGGVLGPAGGATLDIMSGLDKAGGLGMDSFAGAAGPAGLIALAAMKADRYVRDMMKGAVNTVSGLAEGVASASSDPAGPIAAMGQAASSAADKLGPLSYTATIAGESLKGLASVMQAINATAERYGEYSPQIAQAQAVAEIRQTMGDFRRAQEVSGEISKFLIAQSDLQQRFEDVKVRLLNQMLPVITQMVGQIELIVSSAENAMRGFELVSDPLTAIAEAARRLINLKEDENAPEVEDPTAQLNNPRFFETPDVGGWSPDR